MSSKVTEHDVSEQDVTEQNVTEQNVTEQEVTQQDAPGQDTDHGGKAPETPRARGIGRFRVRSTRLKWIGAAVVVAALVSCLAFQYWQYAEPERAAERARQEVGEVAAAGAVAILSYEHASVDRDVAAARDRLTGEFLEYYRDFTSKVVVPAAKEKSVDTKASVVGTAIASASADRAVVLAFVNQSTVTADNASPTLTASSVRVELTKVDGEWLIERFDPV